MIVAGAFAVGANVGILDASSDHRIGKLAAAGDLTPKTGPVPAPAATVPATSTTPAPQLFLVEGVATVAVDATGDVLTASVVDADPGWTWAAPPSDATHVQITFSDGGRSLVFTATEAADGSLAVGVDDATPGTASGVTATTAPPRVGPDDRADHEEREEHEGRDDDD